MIQHHSTHSQSMSDGLVLRGRIWWIDLCINGQRVRRSTRTDDLSLARLEVERLRHDMLVGRITGTMPEALRPKVPLATQVERMLEDMRQQGLRPSSCRRYAAPLRSFTAWMTARMTRAPMVNDITPAVMREWRNHAECTPRHGIGRIGNTPRPPSPRTVANELDILRAFLRRCVAAGLLASNPEAGVGRPRHAYENRVRALGEDQVERLLEAADTWDQWAPSRNQHYGPILGLVMRCYLHTGLRREELRQITVTDATARDSHGLRILRIRQRRHPVTVLVPCTAKRMGERPCPCRQPWPHEVNAAPDAPRQLHRAADVFQIDLDHAWLPKSRGRDVPLSTTALSVIDDIRAWRDQLVASDLPLARARRDLGLPEPPFLIPDQTGLPWRWPMHYIMRHCSARAGISPVVRTHDLRHTFATRLRQRGVKLETIKELLGHADIAETMCYAHYDNREGHEAVSLLG